MKRLVVLLLALALVLPAAAWAQAKANFSGTWTSGPSQERPGTRPPPARAGGGGSRGGGRGSGGPVATTLKVKQTATELTVQSTTNAGSTTSVYKLDGTETVTQLPNGEPRRRTKVRWDGAKLVLDSTQSPPGGQFEIHVKDVWNLDAGVLTIERTTNAPVGANTRKLVYKKGA